MPNFELENWGQNLHNIFSSNSYWANVKDWEKHLDLQTSRTCNLAIDLIVDDCYAIRDSNFFFFLFQYPVASMEPSGTKYTLSTGLSFKSGSGCSTSLILTNWMPTAYLSRSLISMGNICVVWACRNSLRQLGQQDNCFTATSST